MKSTADGLANIQPIAAFGRKRVLFSDGDSSTGYAIVCNHDQFFKKHGTEIICRMADCKSPVENSPIKHTASHLPFLLGANGNQE